ncbi:cation transporter dimerization domain-containing protein, partial [Rhizobium ruizarguesonis]
MEIRHAAEHVAGIGSLKDVKARWIGHRLNADVTISVSGDKPVADAKVIVDTLRNELHAHLPALGTATIQ